MKILLIDNEAPIRQLLKQMILDLQNPSLELAEADGVQTGLSLIFSFKPDLVFLDIEMDDGTGFDLMRQIPNPDFELIFTTAHNQYAIEAFKFSAMHYLLKPVDPFELRNSIEKADRTIRNKDLSQQLQIMMQQLAYKNDHDRKIVLKDSESTYFIKVSDILYCEAEGTYTKFYFTNNAPILVSKNLKEYEALLEPLGFIRTHHSYLANPDHIRMYEKNDGGALILDGGHSVPVSQRKKEMVMHILESRV
ncbi:MAG: response regulator transcription factor [Chitinophagaceae bacterium]|nr:response regulator transcription factor [Chitinophagaceae bacterium]